MPSSILKDYLKICLVCIVLVMVVGFILFFFRELFRAASWECEIYQPLNITWVEKDTGEVKYNTQTVCTKYVR